MSEQQVIAGRYVLDAKVGQGAMGAVFRALDRQTGSTVAIKSIRSDIINADESLLARFRREGEALSQLDHPNIVKMLDSVTEDEQHYIIMEYVGGGSLRDLLSRQPQPPLKQVVEIALDLADALTRAHRLKIIHRDLKPSNILLADDNTPRLTDFGVAHMSDGTRLTETGAIIGTYAYLSPEACRGEELDPLADIWSFGVVLYEMLTARRPFTGRQPAALITQIIANPVPPIASVRPDLPQALVALVEQMLEKDRAARIASVRRVGAHLELIAANLDAPQSGINTTPAPVKIAVNESRFATPTPSSAVFSEAQLEGPTTLPGMGKRAHLNPLLLIVAAALGLAIIAVVALLFVDPFASENDERAALPVAAPFAVGNTGVLVAEIEQVGSEVRDVQRFIVDDLQQHFGDIPFANIPVRAYPAVITSDEQARMIAEQSGATVIIWGNYDAQRVELEVQIGDLTPYTDLLFSQDDVQNLLNGRIRMFDERRETAAYSVVAVMDGLTAFTGANTFQIPRNLAILEQVDTRGAEPVGNSVAAHYHRFLLHYIDDTQMAVDELGEAIRLDASNPVLFAARALGRQRLGQLELALEDIETSQRIGPQGWYLPAFNQANIAFYFQNDMPAALPHLDEVIAALPDDWFALTTRSGSYYFQGDYKRAQADAETAIALDSEVNFPYMIAIGIALREGRFAEAQELLDTVLRKFPDPALAERAVSVTLNTDAADNDVISAIAAFGNLTLRQWREVVAEADGALERGAQLSDLGFLGGLAHCNLGNYEAAEAAYSYGIELDPDYTLLYALRAEVRQKQGDLLGAGADTIILSNSDLAPAFAPLLPAFLSGEVNCENFLDVDLAAFMAAATPELEPTAAKATPDSNG